MRQANRAEDIDRYEGLVLKTSQMFAELVGLEMDDMCQELRMKVVKALRSYDPTRSKMSERAYVYSCVANLVKDLKRDRARRSARLHISYIEGFGHMNGPGGTVDTFDLFERRFMHSSHDETYSPIEDGFVMPSTVTSDEQEIVYLLVIGYAQTEIAATLALDYAEVLKAMRVLREKFADWRPTPQDLPVAPPVAAAPAAQAIAA